MADPQTSKFRVELEDGQTYDIEVEGTEPPTEEEIYAFMDQQKASAPKATGELRPHNPGLAEQGLGALSDMGGIPAVLSGAARDIVAPISKGADLLRNVLPDQDEGAPGLKEAIERMFGTTSRMPDQPVNPEEKLGSGLATAIGVGSLPAAAPAITTNLRRGAQGVGRLLDGKWGNMILPESNQPGVMAVLGRMREDIAQRLMGPNAGGRLAGQTGEQAAQEALDSLLQEGGRYTTVKPTNPAGGGFTTPPADDVEAALARATSMEGNAGGRLVPGSARTTPIDSSVQRSLDDLMRQGSTSREIPLSHPTGGGFTTPPDAPRLAKDPVKALAKEIRKSTTGTNSRLRELSSKSILTPEEMQELNFLNNLAATQARESGMSYAARGKGR